MAIVRINGTVITPHLEVWEKHFPIVSGVVTPGIYFGFKKQLNLLGVTLIILIDKSIPKKNTKMKKAQGTL